jgi:hypothetical protein
MTARRKWALCVAIVFAMPATVFANAGTPLIWVSMAHLFFGNLLIGALEGTVLSRWFNAPSKSSHAWMIGANFLSMAAGAWLLADVGNRSLHFDLENAHRWLWISAGAAFAITIVLEFPFVFLAIGKVGKRFQKALAANLVVQTISYLVLFGIYLSAGNVSALTQLKLMPLAEMNAAKNVSVYYVQAGSEDVCVGKLSDGIFNEVETLPREGKIDRLAVEVSHDHWNLIAMDRGGQTWPLITNMSGVVVEATHRRASHMNFGRAPELSGAAKLDWEYLTGFWEASGVIAINRRTAERRRFALETPFASWKARNATVLPDGKLLFQFGKDQICLLDAERKAIALVTRGRGPVAVVPE